MSNKTGIPALDAVIKATGKKFGKEFGGRDWGDWEPLPTGSAQLDHALHIGGLPRKTIIEVIGQYSSSKTSFVLNMISQAQSRRRRLGIEGRVDLILDLERSMTTSFIKGFGIDLDQVVWERPDSAEEALQIGLDYVKSGAIDICMYDSVDAMQNVKQMRRSVGETDVGGISKDMSFASRQMAKLCAEYDTTYMFINQIRMNPGAMFGSPETTPGGKSLGFYASVRLKLMSRQPNTDIPNAYTMRVQIKKTRCGPDFDGVIKIPFVHASGVARVLDINSLAKNFNLIRHSNGISKVRWNPETDPSDSGSWQELLPEIGRGKASAFATLEENPWLLEKLRQLCLNAGNVPGAMSVEQINAIGEDYYESNSD